MKLHLPVSLRRSVLAVLTATLATLGSGAAYAGTMYNDLFSLQTYTDFGQNCGRYVVGTKVNALLQSIRDTNGVQIVRNDGTVSYTLTNGMIDYSAASNNGASTLVGYNTLSTVNHNGVQNPAYSERVVGWDNAVKYQGIEFRYGSYFRTQLSGVDLKITRLSKVVTDVAAAQEYSGDGLTKGQMVYHTGMGGMSNETGGLAGAYTFATGGVMPVYSYGTNADGTKGTVITMFETSEPLPWLCEGGDSGSGLYTWDSNTGSYAYVGAVDYFTSVPSSGTLTNNAWEKEQMAAVTDTFALNTETHNLTLASGSTLVEGSEEAYDIENLGQTIEAAQYYTELSYGAETAGHVSVINSEYAETWKDLSAEKDKDNWYAYDDTFLQYSNTTDAHANKMLTYGDLYRTRNSVLTAADSSAYTISLQGRIDTGIGYVQFSKADSADTAEFIVTDGTEDGSGRLNTAGFVVDEGVNLHLRFKNDESYVREWRKVGEGTLTIDGTGNNDTLLNVGGTGLTELAQQVGYAAYNVLANSGSTVRIADIDQIYRDFTFGNGGATLDFNGQSMTWNNSAAADTAGFTIHALTEEALITNTTGITKLTITDAGTEYKGSFADTAGGALQITYAGALDSSFDMHSIHTSLTSNAASSFTVTSGSVVLSGIHTVHGEGSLNGRNATRLDNALDWHYADAAMNVTVEGGTFELGSHARLTGNVSVSSGGTFTMAENTQHAQEYVEGGSQLEDVSKYSDYYGLKGNVTLAEGAEMNVVFSEATEATTTYSGTISGAGSLSVDAGMKGGILKLTGDNSLLTGEKTLTAGELWAEFLESLGDVSENAWLINDKGVMVNEAFATTDNTTVLSYIDGNSTGVLALTADRTEAFDLSEHQGLIIGAVKGLNVNYGTAEVEIAAQDNKWNFGGGGGTITIKGLLNDKSSTLVLGNEYTRGRVILDNAGNQIGNIDFAGAVTLEYTSKEALGGCSVGLIYGVSMIATAADDIKNIVAPTATGALLLDNIGDQNLDLSDHKTLSLGADVSADLTGNLTLADGEAYRFGGGKGALTVAQALTGERDLIVDGQETTGGQVILSKAATLTGSVTVQGWDNERLFDETAGSGNVTLKLAADNALSSASTVSLSNNGVLDLGTTTQRFDSLSMESGTSVIGSSTLDLTMAGSSIDGSVAASTLNLHTAVDTSIAGSVAVSTLTKDGVGTLKLSNASYSTLNINEGTVQLQANNTASGVKVNVAENCTLDLTQYGFATGSEGAVISLSDGSSLLTHWSGATPYYRIDVAAGADVTYGCSPTSRWADWYNGALGYTKMGDNSTMHITKQNVTIKSTIFGWIGTTLSVESSYIKVGNISSIQPMIDLAGAEQLDGTRDGASIYFTTSTLSVLGFNVESGRSGTIGCNGTGVTPDVTASYGLTGGGAFTISGSGMTLQTGNYEGHESDMQTLTVDAANVTLKGGLTFRESEGSAATVTNSGSLTFSNATLKAENNSWHIDSDLTIGAGTKTTAAEGKSIGFGGKVTFTGTLTNSGDLSFTGSATATGLSSFTAAGSEKTGTYTDGTNGYTLADDKKIYTVLDNSNGTGATGLKGHIAAEGIYFIHEDGGSVNAVALTDNTYHFNQTGSQTFDNQASGYAVEQGMTGNVNFDDITTGTQALTKTGAGTLVLTGADSTLSGQVTLSSGTLQVGDGTEAINLAFDGGIVVESEATLDITAGAEVSLGGSSTLSSTLVNNGSLSINGSLTVASFNGFEKLASAEVEYSDGANGYQSAGDTYRIIKNSDSGTISGASAITSGGNYIFKTEEGTTNIIAQMVGDKTYHVNDGTVVYGASDNTAAAAATESINLNGGTLQLEQSLSSTHAAISGFVTLAKDSTVSIGRDASLSSASVNTDSHTLTLAGAGNYILNMTNATAATDISQYSTALGGEWTGKVTLTGAGINPENRTDYQIGQLQLNNFGPNVELKGVQAWLDVNNRNLTKNLEFTNPGTASNNYALLISDGSSGSIDSNAITFSGTISGDGTVARCLYATRQDYKFTGDISDWTGAFTHLNDATSNIFLQGNVSAVKFDMQKGSGSINVTIDGTNDKTISSVLNISSMTLLAGQTELSACETAMTMSSLDISKASTSTASLLLKREMTVDNIWLNNTDTSLISIEDDGVLRSKGITYAARTNGTAATMKTTTSDKEASFTSAAITNLKVSHAVVTVEEGTTSNNTIGLQLEDVSLVNASSTAVCETNNANTSFAAVTAAAGDIAFLNKASSLSVEDLTMASGRTVGVYTGAEQTAENEAALAVTKSLTAAAGAVLNANLTLSGATVSLASGGLAMGSTLTLNSDNTLQNVAEGALFTGVDGLVINDATYSAPVDAHSVFSNLAAGQYNIVYDGVPDGTVSLVMTTPEPATATLSLLALSGLLLRRRRAR